MAAPPGLHHPAKRQKRAETAAAEHVAKEASEHALVEAAAASKTSDGLYDVVTDDCTSHDAVREHIRVLWPFLKSSGVFLFSVASGSTVPSSHIAHDVRAWISILSERMAFHHGENGFGFKHTSHWRQQRPQVPSAPRQPGNAHGQ